MQWKTTHLLQISKIEEGQDTHNVEVRHKSSRVVEPELIRETKIFHFYKEPEVYKGKNTRGIGWTYKRLSLGT